MLALAATASCLKAPMTPPKAMSRGAALRVGLLGAATAMLGEAPAAQAAKGAWDPCAPPALTAIHAPALAAMTRLP